MTSPEVSSVTKEGMLAAANRMKEAATKVKAERKDVEDAITRLFGSFTGGAATSYRRAMTNWFGNVDAITNELNRMTEVMNTGADLVDKGDHHTTDLSDDMDRAITSASHAGLFGL